MQMSLSFEPGLSSNHSTCREFVDERIGEANKLNKIIAADMDLSPSHLRRKLTQGEGDTARFTLDEFEKYIQTQGDVQPILWLVDKYMNSNNQIKQLEEELARLKRSPSSSGSG
jgi:hypothetical protein